MHGFPSALMDRLDSGPRYSGPPAVIERLPQRVHAAVATMESRGFNVLADLNKIPEVERHEAMAAIALDVRPGSERWRDWLVAVIQAIKAAEDGLTPHDLYDFLAERGRPFS
jgi:hypothetical protein